MDLTPDHADSMFKVVRPALSEATAARLGRLALPGRKPLDTPNFVGLTSRGAVPHLTPDVMAKYTQLGGVYMALEDFVEKSTKRVSPAIYNAPSTQGRPVHAYTALPDTMFAVLGARRHPAVLAPMGNGQNYVSINTSTGFQSLTNEAYIDAIRVLKPDIAIPLADLTFGTGMPSAKRQLRMAERTEDWIDQFFEKSRAMEAVEPAGIKVFAPILPIPYPMQWAYLDRVWDSHSQDISGLAVYDADVLPDLLDSGKLDSLPRLSMEMPRSPHDMLRQVSLGIDMFGPTFLNSISDAGIALTFEFPVKSTADGNVKPLGMDMWSTEHQVSVVPLVDGCKCYACTKHHRAYLQHLLNAKEMLGWNLLQIHNHHTVSEFFAGIRATLSESPSQFQDECNKFFRAYELELPLGTGVRPRARGYHLKSAAHQPKINKPAWQRYEGDEAGGDEMDLDAAGAGGLNAA